MTFVDSDISKYRLIRVIQDCHTMTADLLARVGSCGGPYMILHIHNSQLTKCLTGKVQIQTNINQISILFQLGVERHKKEQLLSLKQMPPKGIV